MRPRHHGWSKAPSSCYFMLVLIDMNASASRASRPYRMRARATSSAETGRRILRAVIDLHVERFHDQITLEDIARRAEVTVQTVLRRFGSRDGLVSAAGAYAEGEVLAQRRQAPHGDVAGAVDNLVEHYEAWGRSVLRLLAQEDRVPQFHGLAERGRQGHHEWVETTFGPFRARPADRVLRAKLIVLTDVYVWKLLRLDLGLEREEVAMAIADMVRAVIERRSR